jgi:hypothetical protein
MNRIHTAIYKSKDVTAAAERQADSTMNTIPSRTPNPNGGTVYLSSGIDILGERLKYLCGMGAGARIIGQPTQSPL